LTNKRVTQEIAKAVEKSTKARKSADARWGCERISERNAIQQPQPQPIQNTSARTHAKKSAPEGFETWWKTYPRKRDKPRALKIWLSAGLEETAESLIVALQNQIAHDAQFQDKKYIPYAATYLNGERWNDEVDTASVELRETGAGKNRAELEKWARDSSEFLAVDEPDVSRGVVIDLRHGSE
jgi:hypothetical protein